MKGRLFSLTEGPALSWTLCCVRRPKMKRMCSFTMLLTSELAAQRPTEVEGDVAMLEVKPRQGADFKHVTQRGRGGAPQGLNSFRGTVKQILKSNLLHWSQELPDTHCKLNIFGTKSYKTSAIISN